jgi:hypothetical protein
METRLLSYQTLRTIGLGCLCCFLVGCQYDPWADGFLKYQPAEGELVGTYRVDSGTLARRISIPMSTKNLTVSRDSEIVLSANHEVQFIRVPEVAEDDTQTCIINGTGSWQLTQNSDYVVVNVQIQRKDYGQPVDACQPTYYGELMLYGKKAPYKLHITIGDPDSGDAIQFEKAN